MAVWETSLRSLQRGYDKLTVFASVFSERVKAEINVIRLRTQIDALQRKVGEQQRVVGQHLLDQNEKGTLPRSFDLFFKGTEVAAALEALDQHRKSLELLQDELRHEMEGLHRAAPPKSDGERTA